MYEVFPGWVVERAIPQEVVGGLLNGQMVLSGGVVRWAAGMSNGGQIVRHLLPVGGELAQVSSLLAPTTGSNLLLRLISGGIAPYQAPPVMTQQILSLATQTLSLSGLGVVATGMSFKLLSDKLDKLNAQVGKILDLLKAQNRAKLNARLQELRDLDAHSTESHRRTLLARIVPDLNELYHLYAEQLASIKKREDFAAMEELFSITAIARAHAYAEFDIKSGKASSVFAEALEHWTEQSRRVARDTLLSTNPQRFLYSDFADSISTMMLIDWMDFAHGEQKGLVWIDELREKLVPQSSPVNVNMEAISRLNPFSGNPPHEKDTVVPLMQRLVQRQAVFDTYVEQYAMLEGMGLTPSTMQAQLAQVPASDTSDGFVILKRKQQAR